MTKLESINVSSDQIAFKAITDIELNLKNGAKVWFRSPLLAKDFYKIWNSHLFKVKILMEGRNSFIIIKKPCVASITIKTIERD